MKTAYVTLKKLLFVLAILLCSTCFYAMHVSANDNEMTFHSIYVGSGDALVVESKGHYMIVDSGPPSASKLVANYISKLNIKLDRFSIRLALKVTKLIQNSLIA